MKPETKFRQQKVWPFLKTLKNTFSEPIQQATIRGTADYILCARGTFVWLEIKDEGEALRPLQAWKASEVRRTHGLAIKVDPTNWASVKALLRKLDEGDTDD